MIYEFQVLYRVRDVAALQTILVRAETENEAALLVDPNHGKEIPVLERNPRDLTVQGIGPGRPVIDWHQPTFNSEEAIVFLKATGRTFLANLMSSGKLPKPKNGNPIFRRADLEGVIDQKMESSEEMIERRVVWEREHPDKEQVA